VKKDIITIIAIILAISLLSCKKEDENHPPQIKVNAPLENSSLKAMDTVWVDCEVSDDDANSITVSIYIVNAQMQIITQPYTQTNHSTYAHIQIPYDFSNRWLDSGIYYMVIQANDGNTSVKSYIKIYISAIPKKFCGLITGIQNQQGCDVYVCDTSFVFSKILSLPSVIKGCCNPYEQSIEILLSSGTLEAYSFDYYQKLYTKNGLNKIGSPFYGDVAVKYPYTYVTDANGNIFAIDENGIIRVSLATMFSPYRLLYWNENWVTLSSQYPSTHYWIEIPQMIKNYQTSFDLSDIFPLDETHCLLVSQQNQTVQFYSYKPEINYLITFGQSVSGVYNGGIFLNDELYVSIGNDLYAVDKIYGSVFSVFNGTALSNLTWEEVHQQLYAFNQKNIYILSSSPMSIQRTFSFSGNVVFYDFIYK